MTWDWAVGWRLTNIFGLVFVLWILITALHRYARSWGTMVSLRWAALIGWVLLALDTTIENLVIQAPVAPRVMFTTVVLVLTLRWLLSARAIEEEILPWKKKTERY